MVRERFISRNFFFLSFFLSCLVCLFVCFLVCLFVLFSCCFCLLLLFFGAYVCLFVFIVCSCFIVFLPSATHFVSTVYFIPHTHTDGDLGKWEGELNQFLHPHTRKRQQGCWVCSAEKKKKAAFNHPIIIPLRISCHTCVFVVFAPTTVNGLHVSRKCSGAVIFHPEGRGNMLAEINQ